MVWKVQEIHPRLYPDEGWSPEKVLGEDALHKHDEGHPAADGWPVWHFRYSRPDDGPGSGVLPECPIVDVHTHAWVDNFAPRMRAYFGDSFGCTAFDEGTLHGVRERKARLGITKSVILPVPTNARQVPLFNDWLKAYIDDSDIVPFMGIVRDMDDPVSEIHRCAELGFKGLKLHPVNQHFRMGDPRMFPIYEAAIEENMVILFHTGSGIDYPATGPDWDCSAREIEKFFNAYPYERTVLAHLGGNTPDFVHPPELHPEWPGYMDTAFQIGHISNEDFISIVRAFGADRILFGTDSPWEDTEDFLRRLSYMGLTDDELRGILYRNASNLLDLGLE